MTVSAIIPKARAAMERRLSEETVMRYGPVIDEFEKRFGTRGLASITPDEVEAFALDRLAAPSTARVRASAVGRIFSYAVRNGHLSDNPCRKIELPRAKPKIVAPYSKEEITRIEAACRSHRDIALVLTLIHTGLRIRDAITLRRDAVRNGFIHIKARKNDREVRLPVPEDVPYFLSLLPRIGNGEYFFWTGKSCIRTATRNAQRRLKQIFDDAGISNAYAHRARHTLATRILEIPAASMQDVADALGITPAVAEKRYAKWSAGRQQRVDNIMRETWQ